MKKIIPLALVVLRGVPALANAAHLNANSANAANCGCLAANLCDNNDRNVHEFEHNANNA